MFILPHSTALDLGRRPYITYAVIVLCIIIFYFQVANGVLLEDATKKYCVSIQGYTPAAEMPADLMKSTVYGCENFLGFYSNKVELLIPKILNRSLSYNDIAINAEMQLMQAHYDEFVKDSPDNLNAMLMYYPDSWNPIKAITAVLSHGDFLHILFNLIFFFAFVVTRRLS